MSASLTLIQCCKNVFKSGKILSHAHVFHSYIFSIFPTGKEDGSSVFCNIFITKALFFLPERVFGML